MGVFNDPQQFSDQASKHLNADYLALVRDGALWETSLDDALARITHVVSRALAACHVGIWFMEAHPPALHLVKGYRADTHAYTQGTQLLAERYPVYFAALDVDRVMAADDAHTDPRTQAFAPDFLTPQGVGAMLDATLRIAGQVRGVLCVKHVGGARAWTEEEQRFAISIADLVAQLMAHDELRLSEARLRERNESLRLVNELARRLHGRLELNAVLETAASTLLGVSGATDVALLSLNAEQTHLQLMWAIGPHEAVARNLPPIPMVHTLSGAALSQRRLMISTDIGSDARMDLQIRTVLASFGVNATLIIPLYHGDQPLGTIDLVFAQERKFSDLELETLESIGNTVSLALMNAGQVKELEYTALHDSLTALPNRHALHEWFKPRLGSAEQPGEPIALMLLDLDRFKEVNDTLGHHVGDRLLNEIARRLERAVAGRAGLLCRLGGDEFAIALPGIDPDQAKVIGGEVLATLQQPFMVEAMPLEIGASMGVAFYPRNGLDSHGLLRSADVAMYAAKHANAGLSFYDPQLDTHTPERLAMIVDLGPAIREGQLRMHYQPKFSFHSGSVTGFEALVRWEHPRLGLLYPDSFLSLAEMSESIHPLTAEVIRLALTQQREWKSHGKCYSVAVNLSARNLFDDRCVLVLEQLLREFDANPGDLELEITETALMHDPAGAVRLLDRIAALGVNLSIDDFGTGYSSLSYLRRLPIQTLKIDRTFVTDMAHNEQDVIIVRSTISLAHNLNMRVIAEGVEDARTLALLRDMGCDQAQGYHLSRPLPWREIEQWLSSFSS